MRTDTRVARRRPAGPRHGALANTLIAWAPLSGVLVAYAVAAFINASIDVRHPGDSNRIGAQLHVVQTATADRRVFGLLPTEWLQGLLLDGCPHWYDAVAALIYVTHFVTLPALTMLVWFRLRDRFTMWVVVLLAFTVLGIGGYILYPAAPPWLASQEHVIGAVRRVSTVGWDYAHLSGIGRVVRAGQRDGNPVAAMPSLHAGGALVVALFLWPNVGRVLRVTSCAYVVLMALTLVYTGEHYVVDVLAGWLVAAVSIVVGWAATGSMAMSDPAERPRKLDFFGTVRPVLQTLVLPSFDDATVVVPAPGDEPGNWSGAASAVLVDGVFWLTYRVRRPLTEGRGVSVVVARSEDGERFVTVAEVRRDEFGAESFERPVLVARPEGGWRLYLSCATPGSKHWWIEAVDAEDPGDLERGTRTVCLPGSDAVAVKDPVVIADETGWRMWVCVHPLDEAGHEDRMTTAFATSSDGLRWDWQGTVLSPTPGSWDQRGTRVSAVLSESPLVVLYDGRAAAADNWHEVTGVARSADGRTLTADPGPVLRSPHSDGALRYVAAVALPDGGTRFYFEAARPDGAHDLMTSVAH